MKQVWIIWGFILFDCEEFDEFGLFKMQQWRNKVMDKGYLLVCIKLEVYFTLIKIILMLSLQVENTFISNNLCLYMEKIYLFMIILKKCST